MGRRNKHRSVRRWKRKLYLKQEGLCAICGERVPMAKSSIDHILPLSMGGRDNYANTRMTHRSCNTERGCKFSPDEIDWSKIHRYAKSPVAHQIQSRDLKIARLIDLLNRVCPDLSPDNQQKVLDEIDDILNPKSERNPDGNL